MIAQPCSTAISLVLCGVLAVSAAHAQTDDELSRARALFNDALKDQAAQSYAAALDKLQQVAKVKETAQVAYREGICLDALGQKRAAVRAFDRAIDLAQRAPSADSDDVMQDARARRATLAQGLGAIDVGLPALMGIELRVDEEPIATTLPRTTVVVDPGVHHVLASAARSQTFRAEVTVEKGASPRVEVVFEAEAPPPPVTPPPPSAPVPPPPSKPPVASVALLTAGGLLAGASLISLAVRSSEIRDLDQACPSGVCPIARRDELTSERDRALVLGPLAAAFAVGAVATWVVAVLVWPRAAQKTTVGGSF